MNQGPTTDHFTAEQAADDLIQRGLAASRANQPEQAIALFRDASALVPVAGVPHFLIGAELAQLGRIDEAEAAYASALVVAPGLEMARFQLGLLQFTSARVAVALLTWEPLIKLPETHALQRAVLGFVALARDDFNQALACFREAQGLEHGNQPLVRDLQMMIEHIERTRAAAAAGPAEKPADADAHVLLSNYQRHGSLH